MSGAEVNQYDSKILIKQAQHHLNQRTVSQHRACTQGWERFVSVYDKLIRRMVTSIGVRSQELDDCVQEVWCVILRDLPSFDCGAGTASFRSWLYVRVRDAVVMQFRRSARRRETAFTATQALHNLPGREREPGDVSESECAKSICRSALKKLKQIESRENYRIFELRKLNQLSVADVAKQTRLSEATIRVRTHRTSQVFAKLLRSSDHRNHSLNDAQPA